MITPSTARQLYDSHKDWWGDRRVEMRQLRNAYLMRYWKRRATDDSLLIECSRGYELIESYIASLFMRDPSVVVRPDIRGKGNPEVVEELANTWLLETRREVEDALRLALIYPWSAMKLSTSRQEDVFQRVKMTPVGPWDVIVDSSADSWSTQRFIGHIYHVPLDVCRSQYGKKKYSPRRFSRYLTKDMDDDTVTYHDSGDRDVEVDPLGDFVLVVEFYDLVKEKMFVWSPDYSSGKKFLYDGVQLDTGSSDDGVVEKYDEIPFKTDSGRVFVPIVPLFLGREPDEPLRGFSALRRVYDQVVEINTIRTFQANGVRRCARQWLVEAGALTPENQAKIAQGQDGEFIEVELEMGQSLSSVVAPMPHTPVPAELEMYVRQVEDDFGRGSLLAPFTRGEATKATATEITALAAYSASEIGRMARERDAAIAQVAQTWVVMLATLLGDDDVEVIRLGNKPHAVVRDQLLGDFAFFSQDSGSTPMSEAVKKQELTSLIPILTELGVPPDTILKSIVRAYDLPEDFLPQAATPPEGPAAPTPGPPPAGAVGAPDQLAGMGMSPGSLPSPNQVGSVLPSGGVV